jgi:hypothetical protein
MDWIELAGNGIRSHILCCDAEISRIVNVEHERLLLCLSIPPPLGLATGVGADLHDV